MLRVGLVTRRIDLSRYGSRRGFFKEVGEKILSLVSAHRKPPSVYERSGMDRVIDESTSRLFRGVSGFLVRKLLKKLTRTIMDSSQRLVEDTESTYHAVERMIRSEKVFTSHFGLHISDMELRSINSMQVNGENVVYLEVIVLGDRQRGVAAVEARGAGKHALVVQRVVLKTFDGAVLKEKKVSIDLSTLGPTVIDVKPKD